MLTLDGRFRARVEPVSFLRPLHLEGRGPAGERRARAPLSSPPRHVAHRELDTVRVLLGLDEKALEVVEIADPTGPGNVVLVEVACREVVEVFTGFGRKGVPAEEVARGAAEAALRWEEADVAVGPHLADQLLVPLALAGGGSFTTSEPTSHLRTNARIVRRFLEVGVAGEHLDGPRWRVEVA